eukprot:CAMPEP_0206130130 /NCGR_PEP_ID=MMETSP1472-20131121/39427_1 /ASSEMBLY_ACC=CAM_ASM_001108 /TAXON_ID=41880 /ORGANISM="Pycnococcus provasolii, Strain RCC251" /LENGTH=133 /DNA_ID=CAMNT_0053521449 /DNA_START=84 /DNA_END=484 /DNA_ORIENTATION=-
MLAPSAMIAPHAEMALGRLDDAGVNNALFECLPSRSCEGDGLVGGLHESREKLLVIFRGGGRVVETYDARKLRKQRAKQDPDEAQAACTCREAREVNDVAQVETKVHSQGRIARAVGQARGVVCRTRKLTASC